MFVLLAKALLQALIHQGNGTIHHAHHVQIKCITMKVCSNAEYMGPCHIQLTGKTILHAPLKKCALILHHDSIYADTISRHMSQMQQKQ